VVLLTQRRARRARWVRGLASCTCAIGFLLWARHQRLPDLPSTPQALAALALGMAAYTLATLWMCERWTALLCRQDEGFPRVEGYRSAVLGQLGNMFLPIRAGDAIRAGLVTAAREKVTARSSVGMLIAERALDMGCHTVLLVVVCLGLFGPSSGGALGRVPGAVAGLALLLAATMVAFFLARAMLTRWRVSGRVSTFLAPVLTPLVSLRHGSRKVVMLSAGIWLSEIVGWWAASRAVNLDLSLPQAACVFAIAIFAMVAPIGFGAVGTLDAAVIFSVDAVGVATTQVLGFVLLLRILLVLPSILIAAGLWLGRRLEKPRELSLGAVPARAGAGRCASR
jgi:uncharacterized membrane protein YbhN (UPF0104 family)